MKYPAPYEWHDAARYTPPHGEIVFVYQLSCWATFRDKWYAVDHCGNRGVLAWQPEFWRRLYAPVDPPSREAA